MFKRLMFVFAALLAGLAFTAAPASAAVSTGAATTAQQAFYQIDGSDGADSKANCNYKVNVSGGIYIYSERDQSSIKVGSLANGHRFSATCENTRAGKYPECGADNLWKFVGNGYVKTKCLVRV